MSYKGAFNLPITPNDSTESARHAYAKRWGREWPFDDTDLRQLAGDVSYGTPLERAEELLELMRESHDFTS